MSELTKEAHLTRISAKATLLERLHLFFLSLVPKNHRLEMKSYCSGGGRKKKKTQSPPLKR